jgi:hypothetical protein
MQNKFWYVNENVGILNMEVVRRIFRDNCTLCVEFIENPMIIRYSLDGEGMKSYDDALAFIKFIEKRDQRHRMAEEAAHNL